ncbi:hypothetical protein [Streptomyces parvulus]|uniref:hypothetical protein n=1 Tax=Streptomyces parvulus TaxID=146923 RepID=UPI0036F65124
MQQCGSRDVAQRDPLDSEQNAKVEQGLGAVRVGVLVHLDLLGERVQQRVALGRDEVGRKAAHVVAPEGQQRRLDDTQADQSSQTGGELDAGAAAALQIVDVGQPLPDWAGVPPFLPGQTRETGQVVQEKPGGLAALLSR